MIAGSYHPLAQTGPCPCGSQRAFVECCVAPLAEQPLFLRVGAGVRRLLPGRRGRAGEGS